MIKHLKSFISHEIEKAKMEQYLACRGAILGMSKADYFLADRNQVLEALDATKPNVK